MIKDKAGRCNVEMYFPHFGAVLMDIVNDVCATDPKRASEMLTFCDSLPKFCEEVQRRGFQISIQTLYLRLVPRRTNSHHGQLHVYTIPVKLAKPQEDDHGKHPAKRFCLAECRQNKQFASILASNRKVKKRAHEPTGLTPPQSSNAKNKRHKKNKTIYQPRQNEIKDDIIELNSEIVGLTSDLQKPFIDISAVKKEIAKKKKRG
eukprot:74063_1